MRQFATITVIGRDKTGVIARVTAFLFEQRANIEALEEQVTRGRFSMTLQASWLASDCHAAGVRAGLDQLARQLRMEIKIQFTRPGRRQRFAIMATREPHGLEALMAAHRRREIKADPVLVIGQSPRPRTARPKIQTAVRPHPVERTGAGRNPRVAPPRSARD